MHTLLNFYFFGLLIKIYGLEVTEFLSFFKKLRARNLSFNLINLNKNYLPSMAMQCVRLKYKNSKYSLYSAQGLMTILKKDGMKKCYGLATT